MAEAVLFYTFTIIMLAAAVLVIRHPQPIYSVLSLLVVMFCLAALFVMLGAYFVAALQVLIYAGAVLVLFLFVIMLLDLAPEALARTRVLTLGTIGTAAGGLLCASLIRVLTAPSQPPRPAAASPPPDGTVESVGRLLFTPYALPFELTSFLILAAIIGAVTLAKQQSSNE